MTVQEARATIAAAFEADPCFRRTYVDNIAMRLFDFFESDPRSNHEYNPFVHKETRDALADSILDLVFNV